MIKSTQKDPKNILFLMVNKPQIPRSGFIEVILNKKPQSIVLLSKKKIDPFPPILRSLIVTVQLIKFAKNAIQGNCP
jgi:hypothetical protein